MVAIRGGYRMARGWHYAKLSLSSGFRLYFSGMCILLFFFLSPVVFVCFCFFFCSPWSFVGVPLIFLCQAGHVPDWQPRILLGMVEARSVDVKKTTTTAGLWLTCCVTVVCSVARTINNKINVGHKKKYFVNGAPRVWAEKYIFCAQNTDETDCSY